MTFKNVFLLQGTDFLECPVVFILDSFMATQVAVTHMQDLALKFVELPKILLGPLLKSV